MPQNPEFCGTSSPCPPFLWAHKDSCADDLVGVKLTVTWLIGDQLQEEQAELDAHPH